MAEIQVTPDQLRSSSAVFKNQANQFMSVVGEIKTGMTNMKNQWEGSAADSFIQRFNGLEKNFTAYNKTITDYSEFLAKAAEEYDNAEKTVQQQQESLADQHLFA